MNRLLAFCSVTTSVLAQVTVSPPANNKYSAARQSQRSYQVTYNSAAGSSNSNLSVVYVHGGGGVGGSAVSPFLAPASCSSDMYIGCYLPNALGVNFYSLNYTLANNGRSGGYPASDLNITNASPCVVTSGTSGRTWAAGDSITVTSGNGSGNKLVKGGYQITSVDGSHNATLDVCPANTTGLKSSAWRLTQGLYQWPMGIQDVQCALSYLVHYMGGANGASPSGLTPGNGQIILLGHSQGAWAVIMALLGYGQFGSLGPNGSQCAYTDDWRPHVRGVIAASTPWVDVLSLYTHTNPTVQHYAEDLLGCIPGVTVTNGRDCTSEKSMMALMGLNHWVCAATLAGPPIILLSGGADTGVPEKYMSESFLACLRSFGTPWWNVLHEANAAFTDAQCGYPAYGGTHGCAPNGMNHNLDMLVNTDATHCFSDGAPNGPSPNPCGANGQFVMPQILSFINGYAVQ
jgi:hypothetical protein